MGFLIIIGFPSVHKLPSSTLIPPGGVGIIIKSEPIDDDFAGASIISNEETAAIVKEVKEEIPPRTPGRKRGRKPKSAAPTTPSTPVLRERSGAYGSVQTPLGRRSARVAARMSAKKE